MVEVADSSLPQDRLTKAHIYAGAGVPEYWIVDLVPGRLEVFREPQPEARRYASKMVLEAGARLEPDAGRLDRRPPAPARGHVAAPLWLAAPSV